MTTRMSPIRTQLVELARVADTHLFVTTKLIEQFEAQMGDKTVPEENVRAVMAAREVLQGLLDNASKMAIHA